MANRKDQDEVSFCDTVVRVVGFVVAIIILGAIVYTPFYVFGRGPPAYSVAINTVSGLDLGRPSLDPAFNLTFALASDNFFGDTCGVDGVYVEVAYRCVPLAATATAPAPLCAGPRKVSAAHVVARGTGVRLPGHLVDSLAADMRSGVQAFEVTIRRNDGYHGGATVVRSCGVRRVGDAAALWTRCDDGYYSSYSCRDQERRLIAYETTRVRGAAVIDSS